MTDFLERVVAERRRDVEAARRTRPLHATPVLGHGADAFTRALSAAATGRVAVIAEVKRVSPALGTLAADGFDVVGQARRYADAGADAISVLTEPRHWGGSLDDLARIRAAVDVPLLRKDVIVDEYQIDEAHLAGADAVLLIAEALGDDELRRFVARAAELGMGALVEAHEPSAFGRAVAAGSRVVGVNARDLRDPRHIDSGRVRELHTFVRPGQILVAESGITGPDDVLLLPARVGAVLVGTALMRAADPASLVRAIRSVRRAAPQPAAPGRS